MNAKTETTRLLDELPDEVSLEDIQYHLYVLEKVKRGVSRANLEGEISHKEVKARLDQWLTS